MDEEITLEELVDQYFGNAEDYFIIVKIIPIINIVNKSPIEETIIINISILGSPATNNIDNLISNFFFHVAGDPSMDMFMIIVSSIGDLFTMLIIGMILTIIK